MSLFFVDSASDLCASDAKKLGVEIINLPFKKENETCQYDEDFDMVKFYSKHKKGLDITNVQLSKKKYKDIFEPCLKQGDDIVYIHSSEELVDLKNLHSAHEELCNEYPERIFKLIDSKNISIGQGLVSYACAMCYRKGDDSNQIFESSFDIANEYETYLACYSLQKMADNQLIDHSLVTTGTALNIKPILAINLDGKLELCDKVSGKKKAIAKLLEVLRQTGENVADYPIGVVYTNDESQADELCQKIKEYYGEDIQLFKKRMTPSNVGLLGGGILGISFHVHRKIH